jgi:TGF-beta propeptide
MRIVLALALLVMAFAGTARADVGVLTIPAEADVSFPFWCDWGYDWDERCYRDDSDRLPVGGVDDKVWRAALRFSLDALPPGAEVTTAELRLWYDRVCVGPQRTLRPCGSRSYSLDVHAVASSRWDGERELELWPRVDTGPTDPWRSGWLAWDVSELVWQWSTGELPNNGVLVKLADDQEEFGSSGPAFPSSSYARPELRPRLTVGYVR